MEIILECVLTIGNLYFVLFMCGAIFISYLFSVIVITILSIKDGKPGIASMIADIFEGPFMFFIFNAAYGLGYFYLTIPEPAHQILEISVNILFVINLAWLFYRGVTIVFVRSFKAVVPQHLKILKIAITVASVVALVVLFRNHPVALLFSVVIALLFMFIIHRVILTVPAPPLTRKVAVTKKLITTHLYIATSETDESVMRAIGLIREAISEAEGTGEDARASLSGFTTGAFDIVIRYYVTQPQEIDQIKERVNLNIIKKIRDSGIKLSTS